MNKIKTFFQRKKLWLYRKLYNKFLPNHYYWSPTIATSLWYAINDGHWPNLRHPSNFNELLMSINLKARKNQKDRKLRIRCADKYAVREYIEEKGCGDILNECYGVYDSFDDIDFDALPNQFVLKMTTGCGMNFICKDRSKLDIENLRNEVDGWYRKCQNFGLKTAEWHYVEIKPRLMVEKYLSQLNGASCLTDYKIHCFNGMIYHIETIAERDTSGKFISCNTYDTQWRRTDCVKPQYQKSHKPVEKPVCFDKMKSIAEILSADFEYVRVDLYEIDGKVIFGELTFTPVGCYEYDYKKEYLEDMCRFYYLTAHPK